jgi:hypothetical protein
MPNRLVPGAVLPDFRLPDHTGTVRGLSELQADDPMVPLLGDPTTPEARAAWDAAAVGDAVGGAMR